MRKYEFFCRDCGTKIYLMSPDYTACPVEDCLGNPLELAATVEWNEAVEGVMGQHNWITDRRTITKKPK